MLKNTFMSEHSSTLEADGALPLPPKFREIIERLHQEDNKAPDNIDRFHILKKPDDKIIDVCRGRDLMYWVEKHSLSEVFEAYAVPELTSKGQLVLPKRFTDHLDMPTGNRTLLIHGSGSHFKIATEEEFEKDSKELDEALIKIGYDPATAAEQILWELEHPKRAEKLRRHKHNPGRFG